MRTIIFLITYVILADWMGCHFEETCLMWYFPPFFWGSLAGFIFYDLLNKAGIIPTEE